MSEPPRASPFGDSPAALRALVPELDDDGAGEARADCARCPMVGDDAPWPWRLHGEARCCTYQPFLANFLVGGALARGGVGAERVMARLANLEGVSRLGVHPPDGWLERYADGAAFGRDTTLRCPYWVGGEHTCGVWHDRPALCRVWFCKHDDGHDGAGRWSRLGSLAGQAELDLAQRLCELGAPPDPGADAERWATWFHWCAAHVNTLAVTPEPSPARDRLVQIRARPRRTMPDVLTPSISAVWHDGDRVLLAGYSTYDAVETTLAVYTLLSRLDGINTWREAMAGAVDESLVRELWRVGALKPV